MAKDALHAVTDAELQIESRAKARDGNGLEFRGPFALEAISDDLTRLVAEVRTLRYLFATYAARR